MAFMYIDFMLQARQWTSTYSTQQDNFVIALVFAIKLFHKTLLCLGIYPSFWLFFCHNCGWFFFNWKCYIKNITITILINVCRVFIYHLFGWHTRLNKWLHLQVALGPSFKTDDVPVENVAASLAPSSLQFPCVNVGAIVLTCRLL